jgi:hypothetical protein
MSHGEVLYLALVIFAFLAFMGTLGWVSRRGDAMPRARKDAISPQEGHHAADAR